MEIICKKPRIEGKEEWFPSYNINYICSYNMYGGYIEGGPTEKDNEHHTNRAIVLAKTYYKHLEPIIYRGNLEEGKVLPYVANIAWLDNLEQQMMLIWFTNGEKDIIESLGDIIDDIDWKKNSTEYCF